MTEYNEGDLIEAVKGETKVAGRLVKYTCDGLGVEGVGWPMRSLTAQKFDITVLERAKLPLPTEPGAYMDAEFCIWVLDQDGWHSVTDRGGYFFPDENYDPEEYAPFTRLVPEAKS